MKHLIIRLLALLFLLACVTPSYSFDSFPPYSNIYVFGDSLSDNGNLKAFNQDPTLPVPERLSNGPVAVEYVAAALGFTMTPALHLLPIPSVGNNFAVAGARSIDGDGNETTPDINLPTQVNAFLARESGSIPSDALYIVFVGGNDIRDARNLWVGSVFEDSAEQRKAIKQQSRERIDQAVNSEIAQIAKLIQAGAQNIFVINAPDIGAIPETDILTNLTIADTTSPAQAQRAQRIPRVAKRLSNRLNRQLAQSLNQLEATTGANIIEFDLLRFLNLQIRYADFFGFSDTDHPCIFFFSQAGAVNPDCVDAPVASGFLFWDEIHPTTLLHRNAAIGILLTLFRNSY